MIKNKEGIFTPTSPTQHNTGSLSQCNKVRKRNKNKLQGNNSRVDEAKNQINDLEHKEPKTTNQNNKKKKESKKMRIV